MRNRVLGAIGVIWGSISLFGTLTREIDRTKPVAGQYGQVAGRTLGVLLFVVGLAYLIKGDGPWPWAPRKKKKKRKPVLRVPARPDDSDL